ncbi:hypothetical protein ACGFZA_15945 [Streptomyces sp. NPDC048211]|uniref:hypothetical protein n=1 Tax=Streptomyces sp. NPDC048211 TaxID=3365516 RepID=UPI00371FC667
MFGHHVAQWHAPGVPDDQLQLVGLPRDPQHPVQRPAVNECYSCLGQALHWCGVCHYFQPCHICGEYDIAAPIAGGYLQWCVDDVLPHASPCPVAQFVFLPEAVHVIGVSEFSEFKYNRSPFGVFLGASPSGQVADAGIVGGSAFVLGDEYPSGGYGLQVFYPSRH